MVKHDPRLTSAWAKLRRGNLHRSHLNRAIDTFSRSQLSLVRDYVKPDTGTRVFQLEAPLEEPPVQVLPIIGDALFDYRAVLDHLMWALVILSGSDPNSQTQFPICKDHDEFSNPRGRRRLSGVIPLIEQVIECYQPYQNAYAHDGELLLELNTLNNIDKHRHLHVVTGYYEGTFNGDENGLPAWRDIQDRLFLNVGHAEAGTVLAEIPPQYAQVDFVPTFGIAFSESNELPDGHSVGGTIDSIGSTVDALLDQFERLFFFKDSSALGRLWSAFSGDPYFAREEK